MYSFIYLFIYLYLYIFKYVRVCVCVCVYVCHKIICWTSFRRILHACIVNTYTHILYITSFG